MNGDLRRAICATLFALLATTQTAHAQSRWHNHIDTSAINEIVARGDLLYMATLGGLLIYDTTKGTFDHYDNVSGLPSNSLTCLTFDASGNLYIGTDDIGISKVRLSGGRLSLLRSLNEQIDGLSSNEVTSVAVWGDDIVYGANPGAGTIRNDFAAARYFMRDGLPSDDVRDVLPDGDHLWIATADGVAVLDQLGLIRTPTGAPAQSNVLGSDGSHIWVGTEDGVFRFDPSDSSWTDVGPHPSPVYSLVWDGASMWAGGARNFFHYTGSGQTWTPIQTDSVLVRYGLSNTLDLQQKGLAVGPDGNTYAGAVQPLDRRGYNMVRYDGAHLDNLIPNAPAANIILRMTQDLDGSLWASFAGFYLGKLTPAGRWINYNRTTPGAELPSSQYANLAFLADSQGLKWFCTLSTPTYPVPMDRLDDREDDDLSNDTWQRLDIGSGGGDGLGSLRLQRALEDPAGNRWFLSDDQERSSGWWGINILSRDGTQWMQVNPTREPRMLTGNVIDVAFGSDFAYVALRHTGIQVWKHQGYNWSALSDTTGDLWTTTALLGGALPQEADILAIKLRDDGVLWIATTAGLFRYRAGQTVQIPVNVGLGAGILSSQVNDIALDHEGNLWVATSLGLNRIARDDETDIQAYTTPSGYLALSGLRYPLSIISPLAHAQCLTLLMDRKRDVLYIGTYGGLSILDLTPRASTSETVAGAYVYPNPVRGRRGDDSLKIGNISGHVTVEIYTLEGQLVHSTTAEAEGDVIWDLTTRGGLNAGSGTYLVRISGPGGSVTRPVAVLR